MKSLLLTLLFFIPFILTAQVKYTANDTLNRYDVQYMKLNLEVMDTSVFIKGSTSLRVKMVQDSKTLVFDLRDDMKVDSVMVNGARTSFSHSKNRLRFSSSSGWKMNSLVTTAIYYSGYPADGLTYQGKNKGFPTIANVSESYLLWCWIPCKQVLTDKIDSADIWLTTQNNLKAYSNGVLQDSVAVASNKTQYKWHTAYPIAYYLLTLGVGDYAIIHDTAVLSSSHSAVLPLVFYVYNSASYLASNADGIAKTKAFVHLLDSLYGIYPFTKEKYGVALAQIYNTEGMENQTMSVNADMSASLNIHELQHQWFGDEVTCTAFNDIWLHEGFATYAEMLGIEYLPQLSPGTVASYVAGWHRSVTQQPGGSVYVPLKDTYNEDRIFNGRLTYNKGASIIHTLRFETGNDSVFFTTLRRYLSSYQYGNADVSGFIHVWKDATGTDLTTFFNQWYYGEGYPVYTVTYKQSGNSVTIQSTQKGSAPNVTSFFKMKMEYKITTSKGDTIITHYQNSATEIFTVTVAGKVKVITPDPNDWVIDASDKIKNDEMIVSSKTQF